MKVTISERHGSVPKRILERTEAQVAALAKFEARATHAEVTWNDEKHTRSVEVVVHVDGASQIVARGEASEFRPALTQVIDRARRMLRDQRERRRDHQAPPLSEGVESE